MEDLGASTGGTWTYVGTLTPAPTPPVTYNGTADFSSVTNAGDYPFKYEVTSGSVTTSKVYTVAFDFFDDRTNDNCANSVTVVTLPGIPFLTTHSDSLNAECPGCEEPTDSGFAVPTEWGAGAPFKDLWYQALLSASASTYYVAVIVDGSPYGDDGVKNPVVQIFVDTPGTACGAITEVEANRGLGQTVTVSAAIPSPSSNMLKIRVSAPDADRGKFDLIVRTL